MEPITSREYKLMLAADRFARNQAALAKAASARWRDLAGIIVPTRGRRQWHRRRQAQIATGSLSRHRRP
jgi:hypothetical protein